MKTAILLHGVCDEHEYYEMDFPSLSNAHWFPWLQQKFLRSGVLCQALEMPTPPKPVYDEWVAVFSQMNIDPETTIVGHSAGCGFILKYLSQNPEIHIHRLILVAPWIDPFKKRGDFLHGQIDQQLGQRVNRIDVLYSTDEKVIGVAETKDLIIQTYPKTKLHLFHDKDHFCFSDLGGPEFPELWDICQSAQ